MTLNEIQRQEMSKLYMMKAHDALQTAKDDKNAHPNSSISRCYYSMFYAAQSLLILEGYAGLHRHEGVNVKFSDLFVKTGEFPKEVFRTMGNLEQSRYKADYDPRANFTSKEADEYINSAEVFINNVEKIIDEKISKQAGQTKEL